jgi:serine/threonine protein kinase
METINIGTTGSDTVEVPDIKDDELQILSELGKGCFGTVYKGKCRGKIVAIKKLHQQNMEDLEEFKKEIQFLTHLRHPNIVLFMGACTQVGKLAIVTEYLPRGDVHAVVHTKQPPLLMILSMALDVAQGMNWLHLSKPPIIHRDLKPTNLLVDENWKVKICDFGLSAWQLQKTLQDPGVAPGTPLWMSPEVLKGRPLSEKADVYSFGIVLWEMFTGKEPYDEHDDYDRFVQAVCDKNERPEIPDKLHFSLAAMLRECWHENQKVRPSFQDLIPRLEAALVETCVIDSSAANMWKRLWPGLLQISWNQFSVEYYKLLHEPIARDRNHNFKCLRALLVEKDEVVTLERFALFSKWFHPISLPNVLTRVSEIMKFEWFHGDISRDDASNTLKSKKKGYFLVRLSTTEPELTPFVISKMGGKDVSHQRIFINENGNGFYVNTKDKKGNILKLETNGTVVDLVKNKKIFKELRLGSPCLGSKYSHLSSGDDKVAGPSIYINED